MPRPAALLASFAAALLLVAARPAAAQVADRTLGVGAHIGEPVGLSLRLHPRPGTAYDALFAYDFSEDLYYLNVHRLQIQSLQDAAELPLRFFHGPGFFFGGESEGDDDAALGLSYTAGVDLPIDRLEFSLQLTPRIRLLPGTDFDLGGGLGIRYYFDI